MEAVQNAILLSETELHNRPLKVKHLSMNYLFLVESI